MSKKTLTSVFVLIAIIQLIVPAWMIYSATTGMDKGMEIKLRTVPVDPNDAFRGKYISLRYEVETHSYRYIPSVKHNEINKYYVTLREDSSGFHVIDRVLSEKPEDTDIFFTVKERSYYKKVHGEVKIDMPCDKYYMTEFLAEKAEKSYRKAVKDKKNVYAVLRVYKGKITLQDVYVEDKKIADYAEVNYQINN